MTTTWPARARAEAIGSIIAALPEKPWARTTAGARTSPAGSTMRIGVAPGHGAAALHVPARRRAAPRRRPPRAPRPRPAPTPRTVARPSAPVSPICSPHNGSRSSDWEQILRGAPGTRRAASVRGAGQVGARGIGGSGARHGPDCAAPADTAPRAPAERPPRRTGRHADAAGWFPVDPTFLDHVRGQLAEITEQGLYKRERVITTPQGAWVDADGRRVINLCANNYLGLSNHPDVVAAAAEGLRTHGFGLSSVRFICGTQDIHTELEARISAFLGTEATQLYSSCFDANGGRVRAAPRRGGRDHLRRAEPRLDHRRGAAVQGPALPLREQRHGRPRAPAGRGPRGRRALHPDRHRRRVQHGRPHRRPPGDLRPGRGALGDGDGRRQPRRRVRRRARPRDARAPRRDGPRRHPHRHARQGPRRRQRRLRVLAARRSSTCCASAPGPTCSPTPSPPPSWRPASGCWTCSPTATTSARSCGPTRCTSARACRTWASTCSPASTRSSR